MYRVAFRFGVWLAVFGAAPQASADDFDTCRNGIGDPVIDACTRVLEHNPGDARAYLKRGRAYDAKSDYDRAIADYDQAITLDPKSDVAYLFRGLAYDAKGEHDRAIADYKSCRCAIRRVMPAPSPTRSTASGLPR